MEEKTEVFKSPLFLDSCLFIYLYEKNRAYASRLEKLFNKWNNKKIKLVSSVVTVAEVMVKPIKEKNEKLAEKYNEIFCFMPSLKIAELNYEVALKAARIRAKYGFGLPDSFQLAIAIESGCKSFWCNDKQLKRCKEIEVITLD